MRLVIDRSEVAEADIRRQVLAGRLLGDVGAVLLGLTVAQGIQQALLALNVSARPRWPVGVFNGLAILVWIALFAGAGLYDARRLINASDEFKLVLQSVAIGTMVATFGAFALKVPPSGPGSWPSGSAAPWPCSRPASSTGLSCGPCAARGCWSAGC